MQLLHHPRLQVVKYPPHVYVNVKAEDIRYILLLGMQYWDADQDQVTSQVLLGAIAHNSNLKCINNDGKQYK